MADELRLQLSKVDGSAEAIHGAANELMKHYQRAPLMAVTEWRNALQNAASSPSAAEAKLLPLLYVANEVLQTSKRNRGNKFLEAFSPVLGQSLVFIVKQLPDTIEKVRRTVKIWGDRQVFSMRFVNDLLVGLEPFRGGKQQHQHQPQQKHSLEDGTNEAIFSPPHNDEMESNTPDPLIGASPPSLGATTATPTSHDDIMDLLNGGSGGSNSHAGQDNNNDYDNDEEDDLFADDSERQQLNIEVHVGAVAPSIARPGLPKRRRSSAAGSVGSNSHFKRPKVVLSMTNLLDIFNQLSKNQQKFALAQLTLQRISDTIAAVSDEDLSNLVGDALQEVVKQNESDLRSMAIQKRLLHSLANERRTLGVEATRYLPWLDAALAHDEEDLAFASALEEKIGQFQAIHVELKQHRESTRAEDKRNEEIEATRERRRKEAEENERFRQAALAMETEAKPGMVWNPTTREYQSLNTDESWRD